MPYKITIEFDHRNERYAWVLISIHKTYLANGFANTREIAWHDADSAWREHNLSQP